MDEKGERMMKAYGVKKVVKWGVKNDVKKGVGSREVLRRPYTTLHAGSRRYSRSSSRFSSRFSSWSFGGALHGAPHVRKARRAVPYPSRSRNRAMSRRSF